MNTKLKYIPLVSIIAALLLTSCTQPPAPVSGSSLASSESSVSAPEAPLVPDSLPESAGIIAQMTELYAQLDTSPIAKVENALWGGYIDLTKGTAEHMPPQLIWNDPKAYEIAQQLLATMPFSGVFEHGFEGLDSAYTPDLIQSALMHTAPIDLDWTQNEDNIVTTSAAPDHVITALIQNEVLQGRSPTAVIYAGDVDETMTRLYGNIEYSHMDVDAYHYYQREGVYFQFGDRGGPYRPYPQIISHVENGNSITCEVVPVWTLDNKIMPESDTVLTAATFEAATAKNAKYRVTFTRADDGRLLLTAYQNLREAQ